MARPISTYRDLTGLTSGRLRVLCRAGSSGDGRSRALWRCLCDPVLGGCGVELVVQAGHLHSGHTRGCMACHGRDHATRQAASGHTDRLHQRVWPRTCAHCDTPFLGTARQKYCRVECRPSGRRVIGL